MFCFKMGVIIKSYNSEFHFLVIACNWVCMCEGQGRKGERAILGDGIWNITIYKVSHLRDFVVVEHLLTEILSLSSYHSPISF